MPRNHVNNLTKQNFMFQLIYKKKNNSLYILRSFKNLIMIIINIENSIINHLNQNQLTSLNGNNSVANYDTMLKRRFDVIEIHSLDKSKAEEKDWWMYWFILQSIWFLCL